MGKVIWSPNSLKDVDSIAEYIARDSIDRAALSMLHLKESTEVLHDFSFSGRIIPEFDNEYCCEII